MKRSPMTLGVACFCAVFAFGTAFASDYPSRPVKLVINFAAGNTTDLIIRLMAKEAEKVLGEKIVCMNESGAGGTIGVNAVSRAKPDGYTIGTCNMPALAIIPLIREVPSDPKGGFTHIGAVMTYEYVMMVNADSPWKTWEEFVAHIKANPGKVTYGSYGEGTTNHLAPARIGKELGLEWKHVPFQGGTQATAALLGGHVDCVDQTLGSAMAAIKAGKIRVLLAMSENRIAAVPDVPSMKEKGFGWTQVSYLSVLGPAGLPEPVRARLEAAFKAACESPEVQEQAKNLDLKVQFMPGRQYAELLEKLEKEWAPLLPALGVNLKQ